jgi:hypothetical protein
MRAADLLKGIEIILRTQPDTECDAHHDVIFVGLYNPDDMPAEDVAALTALGWRKNEDSWARST